MPQAVNMRRREQPLAQPAPGPEQPAPRQQRKIIRREQPTARQPQPQQPLTVPQGRRQGHPGKIALLQPVGEGKQQSPAHHRRPGRQMHLRKRTVQRTPQQQAQRQQVQDTEADGARRAHNAADEADPPGKKSAPQPPPHVVAA